MLYEVPRERIATAHFRTRQCLPFTHFETKGLVKGSFITKRGMEAAGKLNAEIVVSQSFVAFVCSVA